LDRDSALTVAFSAKESLFKCLLPSVSVFFGFRDAKVVNADADKRRLILELTTNITSEFQRGWRAVAAVEINRPFVHTGVLRSVS
jgi:4'-phosphopantetheinyl transferase EntD